MVAPQNYSYQIRLKCWIKDFLEGHAAPPNLPAFPSDQPDLVSPAIMISALATNLSALWRSYSRLSAVVFSISGV